MRRSLASLVQAANATLMANGELDRVGEFFAPDYVAHGTANELRGQLAIRKFAGSIRRAFSDLEVHVDVLVEGKNRVAWQRTLRGTHGRKYKGFPPSGRRLVWRDMVTSSIQDGLITEDWVLTDLAEQLLRARKR